MPFGALFEISQTRFAIYSGNDQIVHVRQDCLAIYYTFKYSINEFLEHCGGITWPERNVQELIMPIRHYECCILPTLFIQWHVEKPVSQIQRTENVCPLQCIKLVINEKQRISIFNYFIIQLSIVYAKSSRTVFFLTNTIRLAYSDSDGWIILRRSKSST